MLVGSPPPMHVLAALHGLCGEKGVREGMELGRREGRDMKLGENCVGGIEDGNRREGERGEEIGLIKMHICTYEILNKSRILGASPQPFKGTQFIPHHLQKGENEIFTEPLSGNRMLKKTIKKCIFSKKSILI